MLDRFACLVRDQVPFGDISFLIGVMNQYPIPWVVSWGA